MMIEENIKAIIFDFGGVLIDLNYHATIDAFQQLGIHNFDTLYTQAQQSNLFDDIETGKISPQRFINGLLDYLPHTVTPNEVVAAWNAMLLHIDPEKAHLLTELRKKYPIYLLSNTNEIHINLAYRRWEKTMGHPIQNYFNKIYLSHEVGMRKPHKEIFEHVCADSRLNPQHTLFIDDSIQHIEGAQKAGLKTIHHPSNSALHAYFS